MRQTVQNRLNRVVCVGYHPAVVWDAAFASKWMVFGLVDEARLVDKGSTDMDVSGLGSVQGVSPVRQPTPVNAPKSAEASSAINSPQDELELSAAGQALDRIGETPEMRAERLAHIKAAIDDGSYETDEKLDAALSRMFDSLGVNLDDE